MKPCISRGTPRPWKLAAAGALGLALSAPAASAQTPSDQADRTGDDVRPAAAPNDASLPGVIVPGPQRPDHPVIPPDKKAAFDNEAAKAETWRKYRQATPPLSDGTLGQAKGYPGLQSLLPNPEDPGETH
jgi:hypothetical protein